MNEKTIFDHEKLDVYQIELLFIGWVAALLTEVRNAALGFHREVCDQLDRASLSSLLNTAEGNGKRQGKQRAKFFDDARGSAVECAACLDALAAKGLATTERIAEGKALLLRIVGMLTKLVDRFDAYRAREGAEPDDTNTLPRPSFSSSSSSPEANQIEGRGTTTRTRRKRITPTRMQWPEPAGL